MMAPIISENPSKVFGTVQPPSSRLQAKFSLVISIRKKWLNGAYSQPLKMKI